MVRIGGYEVVWLLEAFPIANGSSLESTATLNARPEGSLRVNKTTGTR
jgi:hypothetical protein